MGTLNDPNMGIAVFGALFERRSEPELNSPCVNWTRRATSHGNVPYLYNLGYKMNNTLEMLANAVIAPR